MKLSDTQTMLLSKAAQHPERLVAKPALPQAAIQATARKLSEAELIEQVDLLPAAAALAWGTADDQPFGYRITFEGMRAIGVEPDEEEAAEPAQAEAEALAAPPEPAAAQEAAEPAEASQEAPEAAAAERPAQERSPSLREAAQAFLVAWDACPGQDATDNPISRAVEQLRQAAAGKPPRQPRPPREARAPRAPREGSKQEAVIAMLKRPEGATVEQIGSQMGWLPHTVRGFFAGLKKRQGIEVSVKERVRMVGPNKEGARGSYTVYHIAQEA